MTLCTWTKDACRNPCDPSPLTCNHKLDFCSQHIRRLIVQSAPASVQCPTCKTPMNDADVIKRIRVDDKDEDESEFLCIYSSIIYILNVILCYDRQIRPYMSSDGRKDSSQLYPVFQMREYPVSLGRQYDGVHFLMLMLWLKRWPQTTRKRP